MKKNIEDIYPLSPMQQGMLFHTLYAPDSQIYITQMGCLLEGDLRVSEFERAWQQVVDRHPILRTAFIWERRAEPLQVVFRDIQLNWMHEDWRELPPDDRQSQFEAFMAVNQARGFDLTRPPLIRPALIRLEENQYYLVLCHHHLLMDGWSLPLMLTEIFACYAANCRGAELQLPPRRSYGDYIDWLGKQDLLAAESFWRNRLAGFAVPTTIGLATSSQASGPETYQDIGVTLSPAMTAGLQQLAREQELTVSVLVQAAWALLLHHYSGERDVVFGLATSGRQAHLAGIESMIGLFVNTLPHRVQVQPEMPLLTWLHTLQENLGAFLEYEYSPLVQVQGWSPLPRGTALFESLLIFDNYPVSDLVQEQAGDLHIQFLRSVEHTNYPLTLRMRPGAETYIGISYSVSRFSAEASERILEHLLTVFAAFLAQPEQRLKDISILGREESTRLLFEWNATEAPHSADQSLCHLFEAQVRQTPEAPAVVYADNQLTYWELNARANQLAHSLRMQGILPGTLVGVYVERSLDMLIGVLGILKAGAAYVPLDPTYPAERLEFISQDARLSLVLTQKSLAERASMFGGGQAICLDELMLQECSEENLEVHLSGQDLAYVLYTSGSTGKPKGVQIPHTALVNFLQAMQKRLHPGAEDTLLAVTSLSFDIAGLELFLPLISGARLVIASQAIVSDGPQLAEALTASRATIMQATPATWRMLIATGWQGQPDLKVLCGGEALSLNLARELKGRADFVLNLYGPTESTIWSTSYPVSREAGTIPIGRPLENTQIYILNEYFQPVPIGAHGDLYIGGKGLAYGYLRRPELTAERFIPHPFSSVPGERLYKTGDIARYRVDGLIEFLGRSDYQVKLHGFRIEPGEIESVLAEHVQVKQNVVYLREEASGEKRLVAYIKSVEETPPSVSELRDYLKGKLPAYMVPALYVFLQEFPLTPNGKIDYRALPVPDHQRPALLAEFAGARTPEEQVLTQIWRDLLGLEQVGIHDNFFDLGGHSLLMMQLYTRVHEHFTRDLLMVDMFKYPTIASLAEYLASEEREDQELKATLEQADSRAKLRTQLRLRQDQLRQKQRSSYSMEKKGTDGGPTGVA